MVQDFIVNGMPKPKHPRIIRLPKAPDFPYPILPVIFYRQLLGKYVRKKDDRFEQYFSNNNWRGIWRDTIYKYPHFHSNAHEVLGIARGSVKLELGGEGGKTIILKSGDVLILPAGAVHRRLAGSPNLMVVGAYPKGQEKYNICRSMHKCPTAQKRIKKLSLPRSDPFYGKGGALLSVWKRN